MKLLSEELSLQNRKESGSNQKSQWLTITPTTGEIPEVKSVYIV